MHTDCCRLFVRERELSCGVSEHGLVWSSSVFADKSLWVTDWDLLMISPTPPVSTSLSFLLVITCIQSLNRHVFNTQRHQELKTSAHKDIWQLQSLKHTHYKHTYTHIHAVEIFTVTHNNIIHRWHVYNVYPSSILFCSFSSFTVSSCTSSIGPHPLSLTFPFFKPKHRKYV